MCALLSYRCRMLLRFSPGKYYVAVKLDLLPVTDNNQLQKLQVWFKVFLNFLLFSSVSVYNKYMICFVSQLYFNNCSNK